MKKKAPPSQRRAMKVTQNVDVAMVLEEVADTVNAIGSGPINETVTARDSVEVVDADSMIVEEEIAAPTPAPAARARTSEPTQQT